MCDDRVKSKHGNWAASKWSWWRGWFVYRSGDSIKRRIRRQDFHWPPSLRAMFIPEVDCWNRSKLHVHEYHTDNLYSVLVFLTISLSLPFEAGVLKPKWSTLGCITQSHLHAIPDSQVHPRGHRAYCICENFQTRSGARCQDTHASWTLALSANT